MRDEAGTLSPSPLEARNARHEGYAAPRARCTLRGSFLSPPQDDASEAAGLEWQFYWLNRNRRAGVGIQNNHAPIFSDRNCGETIKMKSGFFAAVAACGLLLAAPASAQGVKIGILND